MGKIFFGVVRYRSRSSRKRIEIRRIQLAIAVMYVVTEVVPQERGLKCSIHGSDRYVVQRVTEVVPQERGLK